MTANYHTPHVLNAPLTSAGINAPLALLDAQITRLAAQGRNVLDYGAVGDGSTDDKAAIQSAINAAAAAGGGVVILPRGTYRVATALSLSSDVSLVGSGTGTVIKADGTGYAVAASGTLGSLSPLTADLAVGGKTLSIASTAGYAAGDVVWIQAEDQALSFAGHKKAEIGVIASVDSATAMTLEGSAADSYTVANTSKIGKITAVRNVSISGITFTNPNYDSAPTTPTSPLVRFEFVVNGAVRNCTMTRNNSSGVAVNNSYNVIVSGNSISHLRDNNSTILGYGISIAGGSRNISVSGNLIRLVRHGITTGTSASGATPNYGVQRAVSMVANTVSDTTAAGIDTHEDSDGVSITGNSVTAVASVGIQIRCWNAVVSGNTITAARGMGIYISGNGKHAVISGNVVRNTTMSDTATNGWGIRTDADNVTITGNRVSRSASHGISITSNFTTDVAIVGNNVLENGQATTGDGINIGGNASRLTITGNVVVDEQVSKTQRYGIRFDAGYTNAGSDVIVSSNVLTSNLTGEISNAGTGKFITAGNGGANAPGHRIVLRQTTGSVAANSQADITVNFPYAFADTNYTVNATCQGTGIHTLEIRSVAVGSCVIRVQNRDTVNPQTGTLHVTVTHD